MLPGGRQVTGAGPVGAPPIRADAGLLMAQRRDGERGEEKQREQHQGNLQARHHPFKIWPPAEECNPALNNAAPNDAAPNDAAPNDAAQ